MKKKKAEATRLLELNKHSQSLSKMNGPEYEAYKIGRSDVEKKMQMLLDVRQVAENGFESYNQRYTTALDKARSEEWGKLQVALVETRLYKDKRDVLMATKKQGENDLSVRVLDRYNLNSENAEIPGTRSQDGLGARRFFGLDITPAS